MKKRSFILLLLLAAVVYGHPQSETGNPASIVPSGATGIDLLTTDRSKPVKPRQGVIVPATEGMAVRSNPSLPVANPDSTIYKSFTQHTIDVLANDYCPAGCTCAIKAVVGASVTPDQKIVYEDPIYNRDQYVQYVRYQIRRTDDTTLCSNWALVKITYRMDSTCFLARPDTFTIQAGQPVTINLLKNDYNPNPQDSIYIFRVNQIPHMTTLKLSDSIAMFVADLYNGGIDTVTYLLKKKNYGVPISIVDFCVQVLNRSYDFLDINNVKARINAFGSHFMKYTEDGLGFFVPKEGQKGTLGAACLWIGGLDPDDSLHFAGERQRTGPSNGYDPGYYMDFYAGPVSFPAVYSPEYDRYWHRVWKVNKKDIEYHRNHFTDAGYKPIEPIASWPAHGTVALGQAANLAPFFDYDKDGNYNPIKGDYPTIYGDQSVFFIYNDHRDKHTESRGGKVGVEIHGWAYAFDYASDSAFNNTIFMRYDIYNRSDIEYHDAWLGCFTDFDIGFFGDDNTGCDVERNMFFGYNGYDVDGNGEPYAYGENPPAQSSTILAGPFMDPDGIDNPRLDQQGHQLCDASVNGRNFGDKVVDNERFGMTKFVNLAHHLDIYTFIKEPSFAPQYYGYMQGILNDGTNMFYGGCGHSSYGGYGPACSFMFPGESDTLNWGTGCAPPNGQKNWTDEPSGMAPNRRLGMTSMGPFTFKPGDRQQLDLCYTSARDYTSPSRMASVELLRTNTDRIIHSFITNTLPNGDPFFSAVDQVCDVSKKISVYPNPARNLIYVDCRNLAHEDATLSLYDLNGNLVVVFNKPIDTVIAELNVSGLSHGIYFLSVNSKSMIYNTKVCIMK